jgi:hypothetical protein
MKFERQPTSESNLAGRRHFAPVMVVSTEVNQGSALEPGETVAHQRDLQLRFGDIPVGEIWLCVHYS